jgi:hypothetical protein
MLVRGYFRAIVFLLAAMAAVGGVVVLAAGDDSAWAKSDSTPTIVSTSPADGDTNVSGDAKIKAKFSKEMRGRSIKTTTFRLYKGYYPYHDSINYPCSELEEYCPWWVSYYYLSAEVSYNAKKKIATLTPSLKLEPNTTYTVLVEGELTPDAVGGTGIA